MGVYKMKYLERLMAIIDGSHRTIYDDKGIVYDPRDYGNCVVINIEYDACEEIVKEWEEIKEKLKR